MREALNENPMVQLAIFGIAGLILALFVLKPFGGGEEEPVAAATPPAADGAAEQPAELAPAPGAATSPTPAPAATPDPSAASAEPEASVPVEPPTDTDGDLAATDGFPREVVDTLNTNKLVVLFVYDPKGLTDDELKGYTERLRGDPKLKLIEVKEGDVAEYSRIIGVGGLGVDRTPALVTVAPPKSDGEEPIATVTYGFRRPKSVRQAVDDALFKGKLVTSFPR